MLIRMVGRRGGGLRRIRAGTDSSGSELAWEGVRHVGRDVKGLRNEHVLGNMVSAAAGG